MSVQWEYWIFNPVIHWRGNEFVVEGLPRGLATWADVLNAAGAMGWELVAATDRPAVWLGNKMADPQTLFILKRRKE